MSRDNSGAIVIFGATSAVAQALAVTHAKAGDSLLLVARDEARLEIMADDLRVRGAENVKCISADLSQVEHHAGLMADMAGHYSDIGKYYFFYAIMTDQAACEASWDKTYEVLNTNFLSVASLLTLIGNKIEQEGNRSVIVVSSVAGDRGRQSNYVYGTSKGALNLFLQGLRNRLAKSNCSVVTVKPGFIDTPMTEAIEKGGPLWASPERVANDIYKAAVKKRDEIYSPWFWRYIMLVIKFIPERIFKRLSL